MRVKLSDIYLAGSVLSDILRGRAGENTEGSGIGWLSFTDTQWLSLSESEWETFTEVATGGEGGVFVPWNVNTSDIYLAGSLKSDIYVGESNG